MGNVHHNLVLVLLLHRVHTTCGCSGAAEHGHNGGLCIILTCSWRRLKENNAIVPFAGGCSIIVTGFDKQLAIQQVCDAVEGATDVVVDIMTFRVS